MPHVPELRRRFSLHPALALAALLALAGCGGSKTSPPPTPSTPAATYTVGGTVTGISVQGLKLTLNGGQEITLNTAGTFTFPTALANGTTYTIQVSQNPTGPAQTCALSGHTGTVSGANVTQVNVVCSVLTLTIQSVANSAPGSTPTVTFRVGVGGAPADILTTPLASLRATIAGPTTDYAKYWQATVQGAGATGTLTPVDAANGVFSYTFSAPIPADATGSYALGLEGYVLNGAYPGLRFGAVAPVQFFAVTDAVTIARRAIVDDARCNACHASSTVHGGTRRGVQYCTLCHNPNLSNDTQVARLEGSTVQSPSMDFKVLIHKIHRGTALVQPYTVWGFPGPTAANPAGTPINFGATAYPADPRACQACHLPNTYDLPLGAGLLASTERVFTSTEDPAADTNSYCDNPFFVLTQTIKTPPITAACTSCHDAGYTAAHAVTMTTPAGVESCATCHASGKTNGIDLYHKLGS